VDFTKLQKLIISSKKFSNSSDGFTHRPWPRAPRFWSPEQLFPMTTQCQFNKFAQRHNFTIYLETGGNANVYSRFLSVHRYNNTTILYIWVWERCRPSVWKRYLIDVQFSTDKLATTQDRQTLQNSDEKQDCQYWILRLVVFTGFPANRLLVETLYVSEIS